MNRRATMYTAENGQRMLRTREMNLTQQEAINVLEKMYGMPLVKTFGLRQCTARTAAYEVVVCDTRGLNGPCAFSIAVYDRKTDALIDRFNAVK